MRSSFLLASTVLVLVLAGCQTGARAADGARVDGAVARAEAETAVLAVTLNIWHDQRNWPARLDYILRVLRDIEPDVIALQEVLQHDSLPNQAATMANALGYEFHFSSVDAADRARRYGNAVLTRHTVLERNWKALDPLNDYRNVAHVRIALNSVELDIYNTHLHHTAEGGAIRREQIEDLLSFIRSTRGAGPMLLLGDFNAPAEAAELQSIAELFDDAYAAIHKDAAARARTTLNPEMGHTPRRIDHIFVERRSLEPVDAGIILDKPYADGAWASDHFGVYARVRLREQVREREREREGSPGAQP